MVENIEVELRSFITKEQYEMLLAFFKMEVPDHYNDNQITYYFDAPLDLRIQKNSVCSKVWMKRYKEGEIHTEAREELEIKFEQEYFEKLEQIFVGIGYPLKVKWFRNRHSFSWCGCEVSIDSNKGYGYIIEIEKMTDEDGKEAAIQKIRTLFQALQVEITPKEEFDAKYAHYLANWQTLTK
jgi:predicted adenylyl cyclase CyaB